MSTSFPFLTFSWALPSVLAMWRVASRQSSLIKSKRFFNQHYPQWLQLKVFLILYHLRGSLFPSSTPLPIYLHQQRNEHHPLTLPPCPHGCWCWPFQLEIHVYFLTTRSQFLPFSSTDTPDHFEWSSSDWTSHWQYFNHIVTSSHSDACRTMLPGCVLD